MARVCPIRGMRFSEVAAGADYAKLITPPYDVITPQKQEELYKKSRYNVIRLEYPASFQEDRPGQNKYTRAARTLREWLQKGVLFCEEKPAVYLYELAFQFEGRNYVRRGIYCGVGLSPFEKGEVIPHEETMSKPKADRLEMLRHCEANISPIFGLYRDRELMVEKYGESFKKAAPDIDFVDEENQRHRIWAVADRDFVEEVTRFFQDRTIFIADGHHRYETALEFYLEKMREGADPERYGVTLMALVNVYDEGLLALPTHRLIACSGVEAPELLEQLGRYFLLQEFPEPRSEEELLSTLRGHLKGSEGSRVSFGLYAPSKKLYILTLREEAWKEVELPSRLDVLVLQELVLSHIFQLGYEQRRDEAGIYYLRDEWEAKEEVDRGRARYVFYVNTPHLDKIMDLARGGFRMPQKSTFFYPKLATGLVMLKL